MPASGPSMTGRRRSPPAASVSLWVGSLAGRRGAPPGRPGPARAIPATIGRMQRSSFRGRRAAFSPRASPSPRSSSPRVPDPLRRTRPRRGRRRVRRRPWRLRRPRATSPSHRPSRRRRPRPPRRTRPGFTLSPGADRVRAGQPGRPGAPPGRARRALCRGAGRAHPGRSRRRRGVASRSSISPGPSPRVANRASWAWPSTPIPPTDGCSSTTPRSTDSRSCRPSAWTPGHPDRALTGSEEILLRMDDPSSNHNGGGLAFGPDGYLYISTGDGGGGGDPLDSGRRLDTLLAKILRIDVDAREPRRAWPTRSPTDNPFVDDRRGHARDLAHGSAQPVADPVRSDDRRPLDRRRGAGRLGGDRSGAGGGRRPRLRLEPDGGHPLLLVRVRWLRRPRVHTAGDRIRPRRGLLGHRRDRLSR